MRFISIILFSVIACNPVLANSVNKPSVTEWVESPNDPRYAICYVAGNKEPIGRWDHVTKQWQERKSDGSWGQLQSFSPYQPPKPAYPEAVKLLSDKLPNCCPNFGINTERLNDPGYYYNNKSVSRSEAFNILKNKIEDESWKVRITVIGDEKQRKEAIDRIGSPNWAIVKGYNRDDWYVNYNGFVNTGTPTIYCQTHDGTVIHRQDNLKDIEKAIARANPDYDPRSDPDLRTVPTPDGGNGVNGSNLDIRSSVIGCGCGVLLTFLLSALWPRIKEYLSKQGGKDLTQQQILTLLQSLNEKKEK